MGSFDVKVLIVAGAGDPVNSLRPEAEIFIRMQRLGADMTIMTGADYSYLPQLIDAGVKHIDFEPESRVSPGAIRFLRAELKRGQYDVAYLFNNKAICNTAFAALGLPTVLVTYRGQTGNIFWYDPSCYLTHLHPRIDAVSCVANAVRDDLRNHVRRKDRVVTIYKGHDLAWYQEQPADLEKEFGIPPGSFVIGCTCNNRPRKGVPVLVEAMKHVPVGGGDVHLLLIGRGMEEDNLQAAIQASPHAKNIHTPGFRNDAPALTAACSCTVLPATKREGLPKTVIESMAYGVPAITTDTGGSAELMIDGESGFVVSPHDPETIADRIQQLMADPERAQRMGEAGRERIREAFNVDDSAKQTMEWFAAWVAEKHGV